MDAGGRAAGTGGHERAGLAGLVTRAAADPRVLAVAVIAAVALVYRLPSPPALALFILPLALCLIRFPGRVACAALLLAAAWASFDAHRQLDRRLPAAHSGEVRWVEGRISGLVSSDTRRSRFVLERDMSPARLRLSWYGDAPALMPGDCLRLEAKLDAPHGSANPGSFDYEAWLWRRGIDATGYVKDSGPCDRPPSMSVDRLRAKALSRLAPMLADAPMRGVVEALTLGARDGITDAQWDVLRATGTSHLVAISGLHIGLIAAWLFVLARWLALRLPANMLGRLPVTVIAAAAAFAGACGYALMAGFALPTQRALVMVAAGLLAVSTMRDVAPSRVLAIAAIAVVLWQPAAVIAPGFWLSFGAVAWLLYLARFAGRSRLTTLAGLQIGLVAGLMPLTLWFFSQASLIAPVVNALLIPAAAVVVPMLLVITLLALFWPALGAPLIAGIAMLLNKGWPALAAAAQWPLATVYTAMPGLPALALALVGIALLLLPRGLPGRWVGLVLMAPALLGWRPPATEIAPGAFRLTLLDVGQGLAAVVRTREHTLVFDTGPAYRTGFDAGEAIVVPYLRHVGRRRVDTLVISHADLDHRGGAPAIARELTVGTHRGATSAQPCRAGQHWRWDGVDFMFVYPDAADIAAADSRNARSCVLRISGPGGSVLLTGDIEAPSERRLLARDAKAVAADILVVAHHGSASSSSPAFLNAAAPRYALISAGWRNRWGFPADAVTARLRQAGAQIANTATAGALEVRVPSATEDIVLRGWRRVHRRFWQLP